MKNSHLIPVVVQDIVDRLNSSTVRENERWALLQRLEAIKEMCEKTIEREKTRKKNGR
jgi:hypothetical protein